jgi:hypothetical protein
MFSYSRKFNVEPMAQISMTPPRLHRSRERMRAIASRKRLGRLRIAVRRAFIVSNGQPICIGDVLRRAHPRLKRVPCGHRWSVRRALLQDAKIRWAHAQWTRQAESVGSEGHTENPTKSTEAKPA